VIDERTAISLASQYASDQYGSTANEYQTKLARFNGGWIGGFTRVDGAILFGAETIVVDLETGAITSYASGVPPRLIVEEYVADKPQTDH
jgi:hypothetical protein